MIMDQVMKANKNGSQNKGKLTIEIVTTHCCGSGDVNIVGMGMKRKWFYLKRNNLINYLVLFSIVFFCCVEMGETRKTDSFGGNSRNGDMTRNRHPFLENRRSLSSSSSSSMSSSSSSVYKKGQLLYSDNNRNSGGSGVGNVASSAGLSGINNQYARNLLRSSASALLDNSLLTRRLYQQQQQLQNNRVTTMISPEQEFVLSQNRNNNNDNVNRRNSGRNSAKKKGYPSRSGSVNSILSLESALTVWEDTNTICHQIPGLTREQMELCIRAPETTKVAIQGIQMATDECAFQMSKHRWNCSAIQGSVNPHKTQMFQKGYRESAFGHAIAAAGVAYAVAKACSQGKLLSCGCGLQYDDQVNFIPSKEADYAFDESNNDAIFKKSTNGMGNSISSWKWSGCSHNIDYGMKFAKLFLDSREKSHDLPALTNLHNNKVGRVAVSANMEVRCKCHGLSGSCELRTCWRSPPEFRRVGSFLKNKFRRAIMIDQSELGNRPLSRVKKLNKQRRKRRDRQNSGKRSNANIDLWYYERSPTYCESNRDNSIPGTSGRRCNKTEGSREMGSCSTLCCGRGYNTIRQVYTTRCHCQFIWCCQVTCRNCTVDEWITVCK